MPRRVTYPAILLPVLLALAVVTAATEKPVATTLTFWGWTFAANCLKENLDDFTRTYPEIQVNFRVMAPFDIYRRLQQAVSSAVKIPDVVVIEDSHLPEVIFTGGLLDLTDRVVPYHDRFNRFKWVNCTAKGRIYALPWDSGPVGLFYRRDVFGRAGLATEPEAVAGLLATWDDYYNAAKQIKEKTGAYMFILPGSSNDGRLFEMLLQQQGLGYFDQNGKVIIDHPRAVKTLEFLGKCYKEGLTHDSRAWEESWRTAIRDGVVATFIGAVWMSGYLQSWIASDTAGLWGVTPLPTWSKDGGVRTSNDGGSSLAIPKRTKKAEAAWRFISFMLARKESQVRMMKKYDCFPAFTEAYADPCFSEPDPFYAGQAMRRVFVNLADQIPAWRYTMDYGKANSLCSAEIQAFLTGTKDARTALASAARAVRAATRRP